MSEQTPSQKVWDKAMTIFFVAVVFSMIGLALFLMKELVFLSIIIVIMCPICTLLLIKNDHQPNKGYSTESFLQTILVLCIMCGLLALFMHDRIESRFLRLVVDGKIENVEFMNEDDKGREFIDTKEMFVAKTAIGQSAVKFIDWAFMIVLFGCFIITLNLSSKFDKLKKQRKRL